MIFMGCKLGVTSQYLFSCTDEQCSSLGGSSPIREVMGKLWVFLHMHVLLPGAQHN